MIGVAISTVTVVAENIGEGASACDVLLHDVSLHFNQSWTRVTLALYMGMKETTEIEYEEKNDCIGEHFWEIPACIASHPQ